MVAIIDDSAEVWNDRSNLIRVCRQRVINCRTSLLTLAQAVPYTFFKGHDDVNVNAHDRSSARRDAYSERILQLCLEAERIVVPSGLASALSTHRGVVAPVLCAVLGDEARRMYQWQTPDRSESLRAVVAGFGLEMDADLSETVDILTTPSSIEPPTTVEHFQRGVSVAIATIDLLFPNPHFARGKHEDDVVHVASHPSPDLSRAEALLLLRHVICLRNIAIDDAGCLTATFPVNITRLFRSGATKDEAHARILDRLAWHQFTSAVLLFRAIKSMQPKLLAAPVCSYCHLTHLLSLI